MSQWNTMLQLFDLARSMCRDMVDDIPDDQMDQTLGQGNSPNWIVGHLALAVDFGLKILGDDPENLAAWMPIYGPGSPGGKVGADAVDHRRLLEHIRVEGDELSQRLKDADPEFLAAPQQTGILTDKLPTNGDMLGHLVTTHIAMHTGQLSMWRRAAGMDSVLKL